MHWFLFFFPHANDMFHVHLPCLNILTEILHTSLLSQFNVTSHHNNYGPTRFVFSLNVNFEIYIMYKLSTHNCCLCQINCCCRIFKRPLWLLVYCHVYAPQYVQSGFPVEKLKPVNQESYSRNQSIDIFKSRQITELSSSSSLRLTPLEGYKKMS